jgi:hypothetical protein
MSVSYITSLASVVHYLLPHRGYAAVLIYCILPQYGRSYRLYISKIFYHKTVQDFKVTGAGGSSSLTNSCVHHVVGVCGSAVVERTALQTESSRVRLPIASFKFFIDLILPARHQLRLSRNEYQRYSMRIKVAGA